MLGYDALTGGIALLAYTLPTLVCPPLGERLARRFGPGIVIPASRIASGVVADESSRAALAHAFGDVMLYGDVAVCVLAILSRAAFAAARKR